jgi:hypothetical protein
MVRTQIQLPDELYARAKRYAEAREISLAELVRRGVERFLDEFPPPEAVEEAWQLPRVDLGGIEVPLAELRAYSAADQDRSGGTRKRR